MHLTPSPFAPSKLPSLPGLSGVHLATAEAGVKYRDRPDVLLAVFDPGTQVAGVFTRSLCPSAPVIWCQEHVGDGSARALLVNAGNANAFTGKRGAESVRITAEAVAQTLGCNPGDVMLASTGVIGEPLDPDHYTSLLAQLHDDAAQDGWSEAARAIMTTDTYPKLATASAKIDGQSYTINGIAKGSGMIAPDMATMLSFLMTDAPISSDVLQGLLKKHTAPTFNAITVDSDTSTSDTVLAFATGLAKAAESDVITHANDRRLRAFSRAFGQVMLDLAHQIVKDGEGARKFVEIEVTGAKSRQSAHKIGMAIANSPLVKTALAGDDANWGRIVMAVGKAGEPADRDRLAIWFGDVRVAVDGERDPSYDEAAATAEVSKPEIKIRVDIGLGRGTATVWTCDLTKQYVAINGDYRS